MASPAQKKMVEAILDAMETAGSNWTKSWATLGQHRNAATGRPYRTMNAMMLAMIQASQGYATPLWLTWPQMKKLGGHPKTDEWDNTYHVMWCRPDKYLVKDADGELVLDSNGDPKERATFKHGLQWVYNVEQTTLDPATYAKFIPTMREHTTDTDIDAWTNLVVDNGGCAPYRGILSDRAFYRPSDDQITVPRLEQFTSANEYYSTLFHEMGHSTGHKSRLARGLDTTFGSESYAQEELCAELCAGLLCSEWGIEGVARHAKYMNNWLQRCKDDPNVLITAASQATKAVDFMIAASEVKELAA
jgi:antirestriction protein ArdC